MNPLLDDAENFINLGIRAEKRGLYTLANVRYSQAWTMLYSLIRLREEEQIKLSPQDETRISNMYHVLRMRMEGSFKKLRNGSKMSGKEGHDSVRGAFETILDEMIEFM